MNNKIEDVLVITGGLAPQLVTETLYALALEHQAPRSHSNFWPAQVIIAGTTANRTAIEAAGLARRVAELCAIVRLPVPSLEVSVPTDDMQDVRTADDAEAFGTMMLRLVRTITANESRRLHVSLAGGRKTMSFHAGVALSLYGRPQDRLSHVLLDPPEAERAGNFWHPTTGDLALIDRGNAPVRDASGGQLNAKDVRVDLANIPYFSVRHFLPKDLLDRNLAYAESIAMVQMALGETPIIVTLVPARREIQIPGLAAIKLPPREFAFYQLLCERARDGASGVGPFGQGGNHSGWLSDRIVSRPQDEVQNAAARYSEIYARLRGPGSQMTDIKAVHINTDVSSAQLGDKEADRLAAAASWKRQQDNVDHFRQRRTHIGKQLAARITNPRVLAALFQDKVEDADGVRYGVTLSAANIIILDT